MTGPFVAFHTERFLDEQPDEELDQWFLGKDLATWLYDRLIQKPQIISRWAPFEEDWHGWSLGLQVEGVRFQINIWNVGPRTWIIGLELKLGLLGAFRKRKAGSAMRALKDVFSELLVVPDFHDVEWHDRWPLSRI